MGKGAAGEKEEQVVDKRITWMEQRISNCLKLKAADMKKFIDSEENRAQFTEFLEQPDSKHLYVFALPTGAYVARVEPPEEVKRKGFFFTKLKREKLVDENALRMGVTCGDLLPDTLSSLNTLAKYFYMPLISKEKQNTKSVPDVAVPALMDATHSFLSQVLVALGLSQGRTLLPIPPIKLPARVDDAPLDKDLLYQLESAIVAWTAQIRSAMLSSPEEMLENAAKAKHHPGPLDEIAFWKNKSENLAGLEEQIHSVKIIKTMIILKKAQSSYYPPFAALLQELKECANEARDNYRYLKPLGQEFESINCGSSNHCDFNDLVPNGIFKKLFHFIYLLWCNSSFYNTPARLVVLIREMCNDLIESARENVGVAELFSQEPDEAIKKLSATLSVCGQFKAAYFAYKSRAAKESRPWKFQNTALFARLDSFLERCHDLLDILETAVLFTRMENMKIGGSYGQELTTQAELVRADFFKAYTKFQAVGYDLLDVDEPRFDTDYGAFRGVIRELERQLGSMLVTCVDESKSLVTLFKVVDTFEGFTERSTINQEWTKKQMQVLIAYHGDLLIVQELYQKQKDAIASFPNMPPTATALIWARALLDRISESYPRVQELSKAVLQTELGVETSKLYTSSFHHTKDIPPQHVRFVVFSSGCHQQ